LEKRKGVVVSTVMVRKKRGVKKLEMVTIEVLESVK